MAFSSLSARASSSASGIEAAMNLAQQIADTVARAALTDGATTPIGLRTGAQGALMDQANAPVPLPPANGARGLG